MAEFSARVRLVINVPFEVAPFGVSEGKRIDSNGDPVDVAEIATSVVEGVVAEIGKQYDVADALIEEVAEAGE